jgi:hypothetical protein
MSKTVAAVNLYLAAVPKPAAAVQLSAPVRIIPQSSPIVRPAKGATRADAKVKYAGHNHQNCS